MDLKAKLVGVLEKSLLTHVGKSCKLAENIANDLIANGVTVQEWISVKDRLPENDYGKHWKERQYYLVRLQYGQMRVARYGYKETNWWIDSHDCVLCETYYTKVTHWMPLPEPPKGE